MKKKLFLVWLMVTISFISNSQVKFEKMSWKDILQKSKKSNKPIFLDIYASWCEPCKSLEQNVYTDKVLGKFMNSNFINVKYDAEKQESSLVEQLSIQVYPTLIYFNEKGEEINRYEGYRDVYEFQLEAEQNLLDARRPTLISLETEYSQGGRNEKLLRHLLQKRFEKNSDRYDNSEILENLLSIIPKDSLLNENNRTLIWQHLKSVNFKSIAYQLIKENTPVFKTAFGDYTDKDFIDATNSYIAVYELYRSDIHEDSLLVKCEQLRTYAKLNNSWIGNYEEQIYNALSSYYLSNNTNKFCQISESYLLQNYPLEEDINAWKKRFFNTYENLLSQINTSDSSEIEKESNEKKATILFKQEIGIIINNIVWAIYEHSEKDTLLLKRLLPYPKKAIELNQNEATLDTYAHYLFSIGAIKDATIFQNRANRYALFFDAENQELISSELDRIKKQYLENNKGLSPMSLDKETLRNHYQEFIFFNKLHDYEKILEFIPKELFDVIPKNNFLTFLKSSLESEDLLVNIVDYSNTNLSDTIIYKGISYAKFTSQYSFTMNIKKILEKMEEKNQSEYIQILEKTLNDKFDSIQYNPESQTFLIIGSEEGYAIGSNENTTWKFMKNDNQNNLLLSTIIPKMVQERLN